MVMLSFFSALVGTVLTPAMLFAASAGILATAGIRQIFDLRPLFRGKEQRKAGTSPFTALSLALAGTLGVGNITGVASAMTAGGPGAVFWMWIGALAAVPVKYAEVRLAVRYRERTSEGWRGGAMYVIRDGFGGTRAACWLAALFAVLCAANALVTGNLIQSNAAVSLLPQDRRMLWGLLLSVLVALSVCFGTRHIERVAARLMPALTAFYITVCFLAILPRAAMLPGILSTIVRAAFSVRAFGGGMLGFSMREALRFGIMRGIFSNEAGCGTSPTAHAAADTDSEHNQALLGVCEVIFDTLILCTLSALVLLTADGVGGVIPWHGLGDAAPVVMDAFRLLCGSRLSAGVRIATVLFAYASIIAQIYYGLTAVGFLSEKKTAGRLFLALSVLMPLFGAAVSPGVMWLAADLLLGSMTVLNCAVLLLLRGNLRPFPPRSPYSRPAACSARPARRRDGTRP